MFFSGPEIVSTLAELRVTHVIWLPDSALGPWERALESAAEFRLLRVCREGEAWPLAAGLYVGGASPIVMMQTTGLFESGDGSLLMNLGCLVTVIDSGAANLTVVLMDNGVYEVTGGQQTAAAGHDVRFAGFAEAAGFPNVSHFADCRDWRDGVQHVFDARGPRFIWLQTEPQRDDYSLEPPCPMQEQLERLRRALAS
jgi:thiamine pyrophosphate-dependent acetolactate synthase large subunit-like protein